MRLNPELKVGVGGYLIIPESFIKTPSNLIKISELDEILVLRRFENTSSTKFEIQTVFWALEGLCLRAFAKKCPAGKQLFPPDQ